jgi:hypothetical protein
VLQTLDFFVESIERERAVRVVSNIVNESAAHMVRPFHHYVHHCQVRSRETVDSQTLILNLGLPRHNTIYIIYIIESTPYVRSVV